LFTALFFSFLGNASPSPSAFDFDKLNPSFCAGVEGSITCRSKQLLGAHTKFGQPRQDFLFWRQPLSARCGCSTPPRHPKGTGGLHMIQHEHSEGDLQSIGSAKSETFAERAGSGKMALPHLTHQPFTPLSGCSARVLTQCP